MSHTIGIYFNHIFNDSTIYQNKFYPGSFSINKELVLSTKLHLIMQTLLAGGDIAPLQKNRRRRRIGSDDSDGSHVGENNNAPNLRRIATSLHMRKFK